MIMDFHCDVIHRSDNIRCYFLWADSRMNTAVFQKQAFVGKPEGRGEIVQGHHGANGVFLDDPTDQFQDFHLVF